MRLGNKMNIARMKDGIVVNVESADANWIEANEGVDGFTFLSYSDDNPAAIGGDYVDGFFYPPQPFPSWSRHEGEWLPPVSMPTDGHVYVWNEDAQEWQPETN